jgi:hypothetical protein
MAASAFAQEQPAVPPPAPPVPPPAKPQAPAAVQAPPTASVGASIGDNGAGRIVVEARGELPKLPVFYSTTIDHQVSVKGNRLEGESKFEVEIRQGAREVKMLSFILIGLDRVNAVEGTTVKGWAVRVDEAKRWHLDVEIEPAAANHAFTVRTQSAEFKVPGTMPVAHFAPDDAVSAGFSELVTLHEQAGVKARVQEIGGFLPAERVEGQPGRYQTTTGGTLLLSLSRSGAAPEAVELSDAQLTGTVDEKLGTGSFQFKATATVREAGASIAILQGRAAISDTPAVADYRIELAGDAASPQFRLVFPAAGSFPVSLDFEAAVDGAQEAFRSMDFSVAASAVMPVTLRGLGAEVEFSRDPSAVVPGRQGDAWQGFLPASGRALFAWKPARQAGEGRLFFTTTARIESQVGAGLLRQDHQIDYRILQGKLDALAISLSSDAGEVLEVTGANITAWKIVEKDGGRRLEIALSQPIADAAQFRVRTQTALDAFPVRLKGLRLTPEGAIRHSGHLRLSNVGSVRLEPAGLTGLTQLAPEQYPGDKLEARQVFVYRFPSAAYDFEISADRVQPEVSVSQVLRYQLTETDRVIAADVELDIREAPIREWAMDVPEDYSVTAVTGNGVGDYITGTEPKEGRRSLNVIFSGDVAGRQLISVTLEKNEPAAAGDWVLPRIEFPDAKSIRGDLGVVGAPGFRVSTGATTLLVEKPLSYFPNPVPRLQQAFRIREPGWTATMRIEPLEKSVQADVFHLYSLGEGAAHSSVVINYFVTGAPVSEWEITVPADLANVTVEGQNVRTWKREGETLKVSLHQPAIGASTLLVTSEEKLAGTGGKLVAGRIAPLGVQGERGYVQVVSETQVKVTPETVSESLLSLDPLELPAEYRLLSAAPSLGAWQYTARPFALSVDVVWQEPGSTVGQVVEFAEIASRVTRGGEWVTDAIYYVKTRGRPMLSLELPDSVRLWAVAVGGQTVNARSSEKATLIPLPAAIDPNTPVEVRMRLGRKAEEGRRPSITLPKVAATVLKTEWSITGDESQTLVPVGGTVEPAAPVLPPTGFSGLARRGMMPLAVTVLTMLLGGWLMRSEQKSFRFFGVLAMLAAVVVALWAAFMALNHPQTVAPLRFSLPVTMPGEAIELKVRTLASWAAGLSWLGIAVSLAGVATIAMPLFRPDLAKGRPTWLAGIALVAIGVLLHRSSDSWFFFGLAGLIAWLLPPWGNLRLGKAAAALLMLLFLPACIAGAEEIAPPGLKAAQSIRQSWDLRHADGRLHANGTLKLGGVAGDGFLLLKSPAVLTKFEGTGLRVTKQDLPGVAGAAYVVSIAGESTAAAAEYQATFEYQLPVADFSAAIALPTGPAAVQSIEATYDRPGWDFVSAAAVKIERKPGTATSSAATLLLRPGAGAAVSLSPKARDVKAEETRYFVEAAQLYLPGPGVLDGAHKIQIRPSQGIVSSLSLKVPAGLTVSEVSGPVGSWQFDAETGALAIGIEPAQSQAFAIQVETQRGLEPLPVDIELAPLRVAGASGEVGLVALAFGPDAQPEKAEATGMSAVNLGDFDASLLPGDQVVLHRVFRYGAEDGSIALRAAPVAPEVRVTSRQVLSIGDERVVLGVNFTAEITRAGLFQLSFPLPDGMEVESLTGAALHHWSELSEGDQRQIVLHLNGKTIGAQPFALTLAGQAPPEAGDWVVPRFALKEATRQTGDLVVQPATGIRLQASARQNLSEIDARQVGGETQGALAFRLLQGDWSLTLGIEKLEPWITGQVLHTVTLREGQTRGAIAALFQVKNASIRSLPVKLSITDAEEIKTLRAGGAAVADLVRTAPDSDIWEVQFKRRVVGDVEFSIEYERRGEREIDLEPLRAAEFTTARQVTYHFGVRASGRLELEAEELPGGWLQAEWSSVSAALRKAGGNEAAPSITLRAPSPGGETAQIAARRHELAESLKLRVAGGQLTTVLSPIGGEITSVDLSIQVVQRSSLVAGLPSGAELLSIFVNGESVHSVRDGDAWQFYILPGPDERTALVRLVYSVPRDSIGRLALVSPKLNVPLENIAWRVIAPEGYELTGDDGDLERRSSEELAAFNRESYLNKARGSRQEQAQRAAQLLEHANKLLADGDNDRAGRALNSVANQHALDAASNEDARVQLENLQTQQAIVGLNTRRQRLLLDQSAEDSAVESEQIRQGAAANPVLQRGATNYRPDELVQLLQGNTNEDNLALQRIAGRIVRQQRSAEAAPQAMTITLPEEGAVYTFQRALQVAENAPLTLKLSFGKIHAVEYWRIALAVALLAITAASLAWFRGRRSLA